MGDDDDLGPGRGGGDQAGQRPDQVGVQAGRPVPAPVGGPDPDRAAGAALGEHGGWPQHRPGPAAGPGHAASNAPHPASRPTSPTPARPHAPAPPPRRYAPSRPAAAQPGTGWTSRSRSARSRRSAGPAPAPYDAAT